MTTTIGAKPHPILLAGRWVDSPDVLTVANPSDPALKFAGEKQDLEEMIGNLLDNACKWAGGEVQVALERIETPATRDRLRVIIDDDGPGLPADSRAAALRRGKRLDETKPGSGLGLSIVMELVELYGGRLELQTSPRGGLRAVLELPGA